jgi:hypothetical protein
LESVEVDETNSRKSVEPRLQSNLRFSGDGLSSDIQFSFELCAVGGRERKPSANPALRGDSQLCNVGAEKNGVG